MLFQQTLETLHRLKLSGLAEALRQQQDDATFREMTFEDRLGLAVDREAIEQDSRRLATRLRKAHLRQDAVIEDLDFRTMRGLDRNQIHTLGSCAWVRHHEKSPDCCSASI